MSLTSTKYGVWLQIEGDMELLTFKVEYDVDYIDVKLSGKYGSTADTSLRTYFDASCLTYCGETGECENEGLLDAQVDLRIVDEGIRQQLIEEVIEAEHAYNQQHNQQGELQ